MAILLKLSGGSGTVFICIGEEEAIESINRQRASSSFTPLGISPESYSIKTQFYPYGKKSFEVRVE